MGEFREDTTVYPTMIRLRDCLCAELAKSNLPTPCFCDLMPADSDGLIDVQCGDDGDECGGNAYVRLVTAYPSVLLPTPEVALTDGAFLAAQFEVGVARCIKVIDEDGSAPSAVDQHMDTRLLMADMAAMRRAITCCFRDTDQDFVLGSYVPMLGMGGVGGGSWQVYAKVS